MYQNNNNTESLYELNRMIEKHRIILFKSTSFWSLCVELYNTCK